MILEEVKNVVETYMKTNLYPAVFTNISTGDIWIKEYISENDFTIYHDTDVKQVDMNTYLYLNACKNDEDTIILTSLAIYEDYLKNRIKKC